MSDPSAPKKPTRWELHNETFGEKFQRKFKEDPLVPIGGTIMALIFSMYFRTVSDDSKDENKPKNKVVVDKRFYLDNAMEFTEEELAHGRAVNAEKAAAAAQSRINTE